ARRLPCAASRQRGNRRRDSRPAAGARRPATGGPAVFPDRPADEHARRGADGGTDPREGAAADEGGGAALDLRRDPGDLRQGRRGDAARRDRVAEGNPRRQARGDDPRDRHARAARDRAPPRPQGLPAAEGQGQAEVAARRAASSSESQWRSREFSAGATTRTSVPYGIASCNACPSIVSFATTRVLLMSAPFGVEPTLAGAAGSFL